MPAEVVTEILPTKIPLKIQNLGPEFVKKHVSLNASNKKEYTHHKVMMSCLTKYSFKDCILALYLMSTLLPTSIIPRNPIGKFQLVAPPMDCH